MDGAPHLLQNLATGGFALMDTGGGNGTGTGAAGETLDIAGSRVTGSVGGGSGVSVWRVGSRGVGVGVVGAWGVEAWDIAG
jgi:hypothetical protein